MKGVMRQMLDDMLYEVLHEMIPDMFHDILGELLEKVHHEIVDTLYHVANTLCHCAIIFGRLNEYMNEMKKWMAE